MIIYQYFLKETKNETGNEKAEAIKAVLSSAISVIVVSNGVGTLVLPARFKRVFTRGVIFACGFGTYLPSAFRSVFYPVGRI
jgi:adenosyl cobinamide kinase/adenosyl cobinamide phosphate guanylyltransferase